VDVELWGFWRSLASFRVRIALNLKGISYEEIPIDLMAGLQKGEAYRAVNPQMVLPALRDGDGPVLFQSVAILEYLDETHPEPPLLPRDPRGRARVRGLAAIVAADSHPLIVPRIREYLEHELGVPEEARAAWCRHWIQAGLKAVESHLANEAETGRFCHGDQVTIADICLVSLMAGAKLFGADTDGLDGANRIAATCMELPAFADAHPLRQPGAPGRG
jgi:maleylacetoacetate isomerase